MFFLRIINNWNYGSVPVDLDKNHWAFGVMMVMDEVVEGYPDGTIKPDEPVTRAEFVSMLDKVINKKEHIKKETENIPDVNFKDIKKTDWYYNSLSKVINFFRNTLNLLNNQRNINYLSFFHQLEK